MQHFLKKLTQVWCHRGGVALIEFVFILPIFLLLVLGSTELTRYVLITQKVDKAVYALGDVVAQSAPSGAGSMDEATLSATLATYDTMMQPFDEPARQVAIISSLQRCGNNNRILWQYAGGGTLTGPEVRSIVNGLSPAAISPAVRNTNATFPAHINSILATMTPDENMIVAEVFFSYEPFLSDVLDGLFGMSIEPAIQARRAYFYPRNGTLNSLLPSFASTDCAAPPGPGGGGPGGCAVGDCVQASLVGQHPCECVQSGRTERGWNGGPFGCGLYRCNNGNWVLVNALPCQIPPICVK